MIFSICLFALGHLFDVLDATCVAFLFWKLKVNLELVNTHIVFANEKGGTSHNLVYCMK